MEPKRKIQVRHHMTELHYVMTPFLIGVIFSTFQGEVRMETQQVLVRPDTGGNEKPRFDIDRGELRVPLRPAMRTHAIWKKSSQLYHRFSFWLSTCPHRRCSRMPSRRISSRKLASSPFSTSMMARRLREASTFRLNSSKLTSIQESSGQVRRFKCQRLPRYIILHFRRFTKNMFVEEKNPTIVNFPLRGLDFRDCTLAVSL